MTRRITITLPDDVAARLDTESNASAYIAEAIRNRVRAEDTWKVLAEAGYTPTASSRARAQGRLAAARDRADAASVADSRTRLDAAKVNA
jgi:hypothetical protein